MSCCALCRRFEDAWRALHEANQLQDRAAPYDPAQDDANTAAILAMFQVNLRPVLLPARPLRGEERGACAGKRMAHGAGASGLSCWGVPGFFPA